MKAWLESPEKALARAMQLQGRPARTALFLPGWDEHNNDGALCVEQALRAGLLDRASRIIAVERVARFVPLIEAKLSRLGLDGRFRMHSDAMAALRFYEDERIDYAFFDLLGSLDRVTALWMATYFKANLAPGATVSLTVRYTARSDPFPRAIKSEFLKEGGRFSEHARFASRNFGITDLNILAQMVTIMSIFAGWTFEYDRDHVKHYQDGVNSMVAFRLDNLRPHPGQVWPTIFELLHLAPPPRDPDRLQRPHTFQPADYRRIELRRLLAELGGLPSEVERELETLSPGTLRALKAWATRRANGWVHPAKRDEPSELLH